MQPAPIVLTTDFGHEDEYVGVLKGVILSVNPAATIVDLSHAIPPGDVRRAAWLLGRNHRFFPAGSIHLGIVDPGVGSDRRIIAVRALGQCFIGPDNGLFTSILASSGPLEIRQVSNRDWFLDEIGTTFHGRDIMAPAAARLSAGAPFAAIGPLLPPSTCRTITLPAPVCGAAEVRGEVVAVDHFGNLITTIEAAHLETMGGSGGVTVWVKGMVLTLYRGGYADLPDGRPAAILNSSRTLEICVNKGSAAAALQAGTGEPVVLRRGSQ